MRPLEGYQINGIYKIVGPTRWVIPKYILQMFSEIHAIDNYFSV